MHLNSTMEGRSCHIHLPNHRKLEIIVQAKLHGKDLFDKVASELKLKEKVYFGLTFKTSGEHYGWIQDDKKVLDHDIENKSTNQPLEFTFSMKFYEDSITVLKHPTTVEIIFLHVCNEVYKGDVDVPNDLSFQLSALSLQAFFGDFTDHEASLSNLKKLPYVPARVVSEELPLEYCEETILSLYRDLHGMSKGQAILMYMDFVEKLRNFGIHYYKVKDKARTPLWLGISNKGIYQYQYHDKVSPQIVFQWRNLENLYFREKKFSVEVCSGHRQTLGTGLPSNQLQRKNSGNSQQAPKTYTWYGTPALIKSIWIMAIAQHQFYWDRKPSSKSKSHQTKDNANHLCEALNKNTNSLIKPPQENGRMPRKTVAPLKKDQKPQSPEMKELQDKMLDDLKKRKLDLEDRLYDKVQELKEICRQEYDVSGTLPIEYIRYILPDERWPELRRRVGAEYSLKLDKNQPMMPHGYKRRNTAAMVELRQLEADCDLLQQITKAAYKLAHDPSARGKTRKIRLASYRKSLKKLQETENRIDELRKIQGKDPAQRASAFITATEEEIINSMKEFSIGDDKSEQSSLSEGMLLDDDASISSGAEALSTHSTHSTPALSLRPLPEASDVDISSSMHRSKTPPPPRSKVAWLESPKTKLKNADYASNSSYPVLPSPSSQRSNLSEPPSHLLKRNWVEPKMDHARHRNDWKVSSLDSLESFGSRRSADQGTMSDVTGSPVSNKNLSSEENTGTLKSPAAERGRKVNLRIKRRPSEPSHRMGTINPVVDIVEGTIVNSVKDSRTSLTDSGHVSSSETRLHSSQEDEGRYNPNSMRREISDSSLSELSTQSNPAALPSSGHHPKFYPAFLTGRTRPAPPHAAETTKDAPKLLNANAENKEHLRKRSSSFTETGSVAQKVPPRREANKSQPGSKVTREEMPRVGKVETADSGTLRPALASNHSASDLPAPMFDTNLNICRQYFSRSQGQLVPSSANAEERNEPPNEARRSSPSPESVAVYKSVVDELAWSDAYNPAKSAYRNYQHVGANNNNNKLNFGQIYQISQYRDGPDLRRMDSSPDHYGTVRSRKSNNVPKCNSLDSVLNSGHVNPAFKQDPRSHSPPHSHVSSQSRFLTQEPSSLRSTPAPYVDRQQEEGMTSDDRDKFNNEAFEEIRGMGWVPSLDDYGSRASVAESLPAKSKKEDIMQLLHQHISQHWRPKRTPSTSSSATLRNKNEQKRRAKMRADIMKEKESVNNHDVRSHSKGGDSKTWEGYKKMQTLKWNQNQNNRNQVPEPSGNPVNIFRHNPPPPPRQAQVEVQRRQNNYPELPGSVQANHTQVHKGYVNPNGFVIHAPVNDTAMESMSYHPEICEGEPIYSTMKPHKNNYPPYTRVFSASPFDKSFQYATLPRHYTSPTSQHNSPTYATHWPVDPTSSSACSSPFEHYTHSLPRSHSRGSPNFHPKSNSPQYTKQQSFHTNDSDQYMVQYAPTPLYSSPPLAVPHPGDLRNPSEASLHKGYHYHGNPKRNIPAMQYDHGQVRDQHSAAMHNKDDTGRTRSRSRTGKPLNETPDHAKVIQAVTTSPDGHAVSVFTVTKSAPNTPLPQRKHEGNTTNAVDSDSDDEFINKTLTANSSLNDTLSPSNDHTDSESVLSSKDEKTQKNISSKYIVPAIVVEKPEARISTRKFLTMRTPNEKSPKKITSPKKQRNNSDTDASQEMAIEAARAAQKSLRSSLDNLVSSETPKKSDTTAPALPSLPPNSLRSSKRSRSRTSEIQYPISGRKTPSKSTASSTEVNSRSPSRSNRENVKSTSGNRKKDTRETTQSVSSKQPSFQRTLSTPSRAKPLSLPSGSSKQSSNSSSKTKSTGMYREPISGAAARNLPPTGPRNSREHATPSPIPQQGKKPSTPQNSGGRSQYYLGQSGTLPRNTKARKKLERSGSSSGSLGTSPINSYRMFHSSPQTPQQVVYHTTKRSPSKGDIISSLRVEEDLKFKRSLSETWNQQTGLVPAKMPPHHSPDHTHHLMYHHPQHHHHQGHHGMVPTMAGNRSNEPPRRTASADDLLWSSDQLETYNVSKQQGTLV